LTTAHNGSGPTVRRMQLGAKLRALREARGITREAAGHRIRGSESKISRMELGRVSFKERDVVDLLRLYGVTDPAEVEPLLALTKEANAPGWWQPYNEQYPTWFQNYLGLEEASTLIRTLRWLNVSVVATVTFSSSARAASARSAPRALGTRAV